MEGDNLYTNQLTDRTATIIQNDLPKYRMQNIRVLSTERLHSQKSTKIDPGQLHKIELNLCLRNWVKPIFLYLIPSPIRLYSLHKKINKHVKVPRTLGEMSNDQHTINYKTNSNKINTKSFNKNLNI